MSSDLLEQRYLILDALNDKYVLLNECLDYTLEGLVVREHLNHGWLLKILLRHICSSWTLSQDRLVGGLYGIPKYLATLRVVRNVASTREKLITKPDVEDIASTKIEDREN